MPATYTFDVVSTLDGFASFESGDWGPFWGQGGPELPTIASPPTARSSGWSSGRTPTGSSWNCWARAPRQKSWSR
jgi:hypothetical protein